MTKRKPRILFFAEAVTLAHVMRPHILAQSLNPDEYEILFASDPRYDKLFTNRNYKHCNIFSQSTEEFQKSLWLNRPVFSEATLDTYVEEDLRTIEAFHPDLVVSDFRVSLGISARLAKVPLASISNAYWSSQYHPHYPAGDSILTRLFTINFVEKIFNRWSDFFLNAHAENFRRVAAGWGKALPNKFNVLDVYTDGDYHLYADFPEMYANNQYFDASSLLKTNSVFLGSFLWSPYIQSPSWINKIPWQKPSVYINLGSSGQHNSLPKIVRALADLPINLLVATVKDVNLPEQSNIFRANFLPGLELIQKSQLVIGNGGSPSTQSAMTYGIPSLGIPNNLDQHLNFQLLEKQNLGLKVRSDRLSEIDIRNAAKKLLYSQEFKKPLEKWSQIAQSRLAPLEFSRFLDSFFAITKTKRPELNIHSA